jgi:hypothetical protein
MPVAFGAGFVIAGLAVPIGSGRRNRERPAVFAQGASRDSKSKFAKCRSVCRRTLRLPGVRFAIEEALLAVNLYFLA